MAKRGNKTVRRRGTHKVIHKKGGKSQRRKIKGGNGDNAPYRFFKEEEEPMTPKPSFLSGLMSSIAKPFSSKSAEQKPTTPLASLEESETQRDIIAQLQSELNVSELDARDIYKHAMKNRFSLNGQIHLQNKLGFYGQIYPEGYGEKLTKIKAIFDDHGFIAPSLDAAIYTYDTSRTKIIR